MASSMTISSFRLCILLVILQRVFSACDDCVNSRASYYGSPDSLGNDSNKTKLLSPISRDN
jgi:hypothetical protein